MITGISQKNEAGLEHIRVFGDAMVEGVRVHFNALIKREELDFPRQLVYDAGMAVVSRNYYNEIVNTTSNLTVHRMTSTDLEPGKAVQDYETMTEEEKQALTDLLGLILELRRV